MVEEKTASTLSPESSSATRIAWSSPSGVRGGSAVSSRRSGRPWRIRTRSIAGLSLRQRAGDDLFHHIALGVGVVLDVAPGARRERALACAVELELLRMRAAAVAE